MAAFEAPGPFKGSPLIAIGWLDPAHRFAGGDISSDFFQMLVELLIDPWQPTVTAGAQRCLFCRFTGGPAEMSYKGINFGVGSTNLFVPTKERIFIAPSLVAHYIDAHGYAPPSEFQEAVKSCPSMRSVPYLRLVRQHGLHRWGQQEGDL
jgi:hypothetical protein